jgi:hypothetical protein
MLYNVLLQEQLLSPSRCKLAILLLRTQALDVWTPLFPVDPPFFHKVELHVFKGKKLI